MFKLYMSLSHIRFGRDQKYHFETFSNGGEIENIITYNRLIHLTFVTTARVSFWLPAFAIAVTK